MIDVEPRVHVHRSGDNAVVDYRLVGAIVDLDGGFVHARALNGPAFGQPDSGVGVDQSKAEIVTGVQSAAVPVVGAVVAPAIVSRVYLPGGIGQNFLNITVTKVRVGLQHQRDDARRDRRRRRGAAEVPPKE